jgi:hypothetical protein
VLRARRWLRWWRGPFTQTAPFAALSARMVPGIARSALPTAILERLQGAPATRISTFLRWLAPITTTSCPDASRFLRGTATRDPARARTVPASKHHPTRGTAA